ncbi:hypothetical protein [Aeromicrobium chenweiae]|uniref:Uncharacterized protein n=1 Tax=Aeromicrobium chenweiae TaxID=2079793 RepID=A0A2S0WNY5_9ACTN|nr:hypothetical protein [Aeromicrobium chenweiae]AWB93058.1 hypothetical protein C3E78_13045 [Aeromicrobium chenweiae]TGN34047.1 hypothetical protein E4L97_03080 [Aeromicrobium chenweiae]
MITTAQSPHTRWSFTAAFGTAGGLIVGLVVLAFLWPVATSSPKDLPVAVTGPPGAVAAVKAQVAKAGGPLELEEVTDRAAAIRAIEHRDVYGALVLGEPHGTLIASGASPVAAQMLRGVAAEMSAASGTASPVTDVVPLSSDDPNGSGLTAASLPIVLGGLIGGLLISVLVVGVTRRLAALVVYGVVAGVAAALVMQTWFGILEGNFWLEAAALGLAMLATSAFVVGCTALIGRAGIAVGIATTLLIANPISGATQPREFIAGPWGEIGQFLVPGAGSSLIRQLSYFPDASALREWLVLAAWALGGAALIALGHNRDRSPIPVPAFELEKEATHAAA